MDNVTVTFAFLQDEVTLAAAAKKRLERLEHVSASSSAVLKRQRKNTGTSFEAISPEYLHELRQVQALQEKTAKEQASLMRYNPVAFQEDTASQADAKYR